MSAPVVPYETTGRRYRSKKHRPCDLCRSRKIQCKLQSNETACALCLRLDRHCTYVMGPLRRKSRCDGPVSSSERPQKQQRSLPCDGEVTLPEDTNSQPTAVNETIHVNVSLPSSMASPDQPSPDEPHLPSPGEPKEYDNLNWSGVDLFPEMTLDEGMRDYIDGYSFAKASGKTPDDDAGLNGYRQPSVSSPPVDMFMERRASEATSSSGSQGMNFNSSPRLTAAMLPDKDGAFSLDSQKGLSSLAIGLSSELDPFLLRYYQYNTHDTHLMFRLHFRKVVDDTEVPMYSESDAHHHRTPRGPMPVQFSMTDETIFQDDLKAAEKLFAGYSTEENDLDLLQELVPPEVESRLLRLYSQFVHPWYPVLSLRDLQTPLDRECRLSAPIGIRSAVYALAAPFTFLDDELSVMKAYWTVPTDDLWAIAHRSFQRASRLAHLSLLQLCLLLLQTPPQNFAVADPPSFWSLSCSALAIAESLGLNMDPSSWKLPHREIMLRRRLWWLTYMGHTWRALVCGRPSHINDSNWDVLDLTEDDFEGIEHPDDDVRHAIVRQVSICVANCKLSMIAADVLKEFYTLRANREAVSLNSLLARAQPLRARIQCWRQTHPLLLKPVCDLSEDEFADSVSLRLSHLTLEILVFRALLRPLHPGATSATDASQEPISTIFENCYMCAKVTSEVVASLQSRHFTSFWYPDVRYQLCYVSTFILLNFAQSTTEESAVRNKALLSKWRDTLRIQARSWPLARLAAVRVDAIFWKGIQPLIDGAGPESPAVRLLREEGIRKRLVKERMNE